MPTLESNIHLLLSIFIQKNISNGVFMESLGQIFTGHVTVNDRIYEITLMNPWSEDEKLIINQVECPEFTTSATESRHSIIIENCILHFYHVQGETMMKVEKPEEQLTSPEEKRKIPQYHGISHIEAGNHYIKVERDAKDSLFHVFSQIILAFSIMGGFLIGLIYGYTYLELLIQIILIISGLVKTIYEIFKLYKSNR